jgi:transposase InsO family protein
VSKEKEALKPPYIERLGNHGDLDIWVVDGSYVRGHIDEEFTNFGQHYRYPYIPKNELWLDQEAEHNERTFFIEHLLIEHRLMQQGVPYSEALVEADKHERTERRRAGDVRKTTNDGKKLPNGTEMHEKLWKTLESGVTVWIVNGRLVRSTFDIDFTEGGHDKVYEFVPANEVWIDDAIVEQERGYVLLHELHERNRMSKGMPYSQAHAESSKMEFRCRHHPDELHNALSTEGWT